MNAWRAWIGREETAHDRLTPAMLARLRATLDLAGAETEEVSPLAHWLCFLPAAPTSAIDVDGHPRRGGFLPPIDLPRRMWAGGRLEFHAPLPLDTPLSRRSTIVDIAEKTGASGHLVFVTVRHEIAGGGAPLVTEEQDLVYRDAPTGPPASSAAPAPPATTADAERVVSPDPVLLFRFSALTFNAHRIHYDRDYARGEEGYGGLVVHGPLLATLLMHHWLGATPARRARRMSFRAQRPLIDDAPFALCLQRGGDAGDRLWTRDAAGHATMTAEIA